MRKLLSAIPLIPTLMVLISSSAYALKPPEDFGIKLVPSFMAEKALSECNYLEEVATRSMWGGLVAGSLGKKGVMKRLYKKANKLGATHLVVIDSSKTAWSGFTAGSAHAFYCNPDDQDPGGYSAREVVSLKTAQKSAEEAAAASRSDDGASEVRLRAVKSEAAKNCEFIKSITTGAGGTGDPSIYVERAMESALKEAVSVGADSYQVINLDTTASGASIVLEALKCS